MSFWDFLDPVIDVVGGFLGSDLGSTVVDAGLGLVSPGISDAIYGQTDPRDLLTPEQIRAIELSNEARQFQMKQAQYMAQYATPEAQTGAVRKQAAMSAYEAENNRVRQVARGKRTPFTNNYYDNIDPIVRRAMDIQDPVQRAMQLRSGAAAAAQGVPAYTGPANTGQLAYGIDRYNQGQTEQTLGNLVGSPTVQNFFGGGGQNSMVSGIQNSGLSGGDFYGDYPDLNW